MTRRLEGRAFHIYRNNGVIALTPQDYTEETSQLVDRLCGYYERGHLSSVEQADLVGAVLNTVLKKPVFTFVRTERAQQSPWFTGDVELLEALKDHIREQGGNIQGVSFYVPFSNGNELGIHGIKMLQDEIRWVTTDSQFLEEFGISRKELLGRVITV